MANPIYTNLAGLRYTEELIILSENNPTVSQIPWKNLDRRHIIIELSSTWFELELEGLNITIPGERLPHRKFCITVFKQGGILAPIPPIVINQATPPPSLAFASLATKTLLPQEEIVTFYFRRTPNSKYWVIDTPDWQGLQNVPDTFPPSAHGLSHASTGTDPLTPEDIGASPDGHTHTASEITDLGTAATKNIGTSPGDVVALENVGGVAKLPAVDGSQLTNLPGGSGGGATNLSYTASPTGGTVASDTGSDAVLTLADATNAGLMSPADKTKLDGVAALGTAAEVSADQDLETSSIVRFASISLGPALYDSGYLGWFDNQDNTSSITFFDVNGDPAVYFSPNGSVSFANSPVFQDQAGTRTSLGLGDSATKNVGTGVNDVAAGNHIHGITDITNLQSSLDARVFWATFNTTPDEFYNSPPFSVWMFTADGTYYLVEEGRPLNGSRTIIGYGANGVRISKVGEFTYWSSAVKGGQTSQFSFNGTTYQNTTNQIKHIDIQYTGGTTIPTVSTAGPGLMSVADKSKLDGIASGAEVNVQADWNATTGDAFINNKPTIPAPSSTSPAALGEASVGTATDYARADHVHQIPTTGDIGAMPVSPELIELADVDGDTQLELGTDFYSQGEASGFIKHPNSTAPNITLVSGGTDIQGTLSVNGSAVSLATHTHPTATITTAGFMSAPDKEKLDQVFSVAKSPTIYIRRFANFENSGFTGEMGVLNTLTDAQLNSRGFFKLVDQYFEWDPLIWNFAPTNAPNAFGILLWVECGGIFNDGLRMHVRRRNIADPSQWVGFAGQMEASHITSASSNTIFTTGGAGNKFDWPGGTSRRERVEIWLAAYNGGNGGYINNFIFSVI